MKNSILYYILLGCICCITITATAQSNRLAVIEQQLTAYQKDHSRIKGKVDVAFEGSLTDFITLLAGEKKVNITIDPSINKKVYNTFNDVTVKDVILWICKEYDLAIDITGSIISIQQYQKPPPPKRQLNITYNAFNKQLTMRLNRDTLDKVLQKIAEFTGVNVTPTRAISNDRISGYVGKATLKEALQNIAFANNYILEEVEEGGFTLRPKAEPQTAQNPINNNNNRNNRGNRNNGNRGNNNNSNFMVNTNPGQVRVRINRDSVPKLTVSAINVPIADIINKVATDAKINFYLFEAPTENATIQLADITFPNFLTFLLQSTNFNYRIENGVYLIGKKENEGIRQTKIVQLQHRPVEDVLPSIPKSLQQGIELDTFPELNALIFNGSESRIKELERFVEDLDRPVPNVEIELFIMDVQTNRLTELGLDAGVGTEPVTPGGTIFPSTNFTFSSQSINGLLNLLSGRGIVNLGPVQPNFYVSLKALEEDGLAKVNSIPRIATLNSHPASFSIGERRYYREDQLTIQAGINPLQQTNIQFKELEANFSIDVTPFISGDENVTLDIDVEQTDFIGEIQTNAPSPQVTRNFSSKIRVKNNELIVLGGLNRKRTDESGSGVPLLSRIPVLKWFFSKRKRSKSESKLLIFIKPRISY